MGVFFCASGESLSRGEAEVNGKNSQLIRVNGCQSWRSAGDMPSTGTWRGGAGRPFGICYLATLQGLSRCALEGGESLRTIQISTSFPIFTSPRTHIDISTTFQASCSATCTLGLFFVKGKSKRLQSEPMRATSFPPGQAMRHRCYSTELS